MLKAVSFDHVGHQVFGKIKPLLENDLPDIDRYVGDEAKRAGNYNPAYARFITTVKCIENEKVKIDSKWYPLRGEKAPAIVIDENDHSILEHFLAYIIRENQVLIEREQYREAFKDYAFDEEDMPQEDPTPFPRVASSGPSSE